MLVVGHAFGQRHVLHSRHVLNLRHVWCARADAHSRTLAHTHAHSRTLTRSRAYTHTRTRAHTVADANEVATGGPATPEPLSPVFVAEGTAHAVCGAGGAAEEDGDALQEADAAASALEWSIGALPQVERRRLSAGIRLRLCVCVRVHVYL